MPEQNQAARRPYQRPVVTRVQLEDKPVVAQTGCKDSLDTAACVQVITDDFGIPVKILPARDISPS
jgi:hypothetical protein